ncbi:unnamed protein product [Ectocarpus sp. 6 AP-2014]
MSLPLLSVRANLSSSALGSSLRHSASGRCVRNVVCSSFRRRRSSSDSKCNRPPTSWSRRGRASSAVMVTRSQAPALLQARQLSSAASAAAPTLLFGDTIIVTKRCAERLNELREAKTQPDLKLRLSVEGGGCSGFQYKFSLEDAAGAGAGGSEGADNDGDDDEDSDDEDESDVDHEFERDGAVLVVDATSLEFVKGATVDFEEDMMRSAFAVLNNPVSESACGCGSSFALKNFEKNPALD